MLQRWKQNQHLRRNLLHHTLFDWAIPTTILQYLICSGSLHFKSRALFSGKSPFIGKTKAFMYIKKTTFQVRILPQYYSHGQVTETPKWKSLCCYTTKALIIILSIQKNCNISQAHILILSWFMGGYLECYRQTNADVSLWLLDTRLLTIFGHPCNRQPDLPLSQTTIAFLDLLSLYHSLPLSQSHNSSSFFLRLILIKILPQSFSVSHRSLHEFSAERLKIGFDHSMK